MSLHQVDANLRTPRTMSRDSISNDFAQVQKSDENFAAAAKQRGTRTPPSERLLAPTQASAAKVSSPPARHRKPLPRSPAFVVMESQTPATRETPSTTPASGPKWSERVVRRMISRDKVAKDATPSPSDTRSVETSMPPLPMPTPSSTDKPLPSRPIASLTSTLSPSKDSRSLIDAIEQPLKFSQEGVHHDWPALTPRSVSAPERKPRSISRDMKSTPSAIPRRISSSNAVARTSTDMVKMLDRRTPRNSNASALTQHSSDPSFVSAEEPISGEHGLEIGSASLPSLVPMGREDISTLPVASMRHAPVHPVRMQSLGKRRSNGLSQSKRASVSQKAELHSGNTPLTKSRGHSPSPASFSRPRPGSGVHVSRLPSISKDTPTPAEKTLHQRTASRIPIPDSKKATLVDIRTLPPNNATEGSPSFGARRLISPNALAILDQGTKRRLQRANTNGSVTSTTSSSTRILNVEFGGEEQQNNQSKSSSPGDTFGPSSSDEEEVMRPVVQSYSLRKNVKVKQNHHGLAVEDQLSMMPSDFDLPRLRRAPPSKSPFTGPLPTIHSQASLAFPKNEASPTSNGNHSQFSHFAQRLNDLQAAHSANTQSHDRDESIDMRDTQHALKQLLQDTNCEDELRQQSGKPGLDNETKSHLTQTLSLLEGHGNPAEESFDHSKLEQIFGQLVPGIERASKTNTLLNDAAAAARFLEGQARESAIDPHLSGFSGSLAREQTQTSSNEIAELPANEPCQTPAVSKWSDSTPSAQGNSTELQRREAQRSIGYPSTSRITSLKTPVNLRNTSRRESDFGSRTSSPTLGQAKHDQKDLLAQGSVKRGRVAGEGSGFARMTASASSKMIPRSAGSASRAVRKPDDARRGRDSLVGPARTASVTTIASAKPPRSRSKSRTVLDKINGFFTHKREKKTDDSEPPPVPRLDLSKIQGRLVAGHTDASDGLFPQLDRTPRATTPPLMATLLETSSSPRLHGQRSSSRATDSSDKSLASILPLDGECDGKVLTLTDKLVNKAKQERSQKRKQRLLNFARVLNDALIHVREAQISAETARTMAEQAELSYLKTQKGVEMLSRLASSLVQSTVRR